jgi:hypothetical protein
LAPVERTKSTRRLKISDVPIYSPTAEAMRTISSGPRDWLRSTGLLPVRVNIFVSVGAFDLLALYGRRLVEGYPLAADGVVGAWMMALVGLGLAARAGHRWAFWAGIVLYAADMIALVATFSLWAFGVHAFFVFKWFEGQRALKELSEGGAVLAKQRVVASQNPVG